MVQLKRIQCRHLQLDVGALGKSGIFGKVFHTLDSRYRIGRVYSNAVGKESVRRKAASVYAQPQKPGPAKDVSNLALRSIFVPARFCAGTEQIFVAGPEGGQLKYAKTAGDCRRNGAMMFEMDTENPNDIKGTDQDAPRRPSWRFCDVRNHSKCHIKETVLTSTKPKKT